MTEPTPDARPLAVCEGRALHLVQGPPWPSRWPGHGGFRLVIAVASPNEEDPELQALALRIVDQGCRSVVCVGRGATRLEDAFLDASVRADVELATHVMADEPLEEALWYAWHVPHELAGEHRPFPVVICVPTGDPLVEELLRLSSRLESAFERLEDEQG